MKKIIWLSSYPKSGNTWMRHLIANYFYNKEKKFNHKIINHIKRFHITEYLEDSNERKIDKNIFKYWNLEQKRISQGNYRAVFLKNHNANFKIDSKSFVSSEYTLGAIHIVRDPRDVVISASNYYGLGEDQMISNLINPKFINYSLNNSKNIDFVSSWKFHFHSWRQLGGIPYLFIKYEDMIKDIHKTFTIVMNFLADLINFKVNYNQIEFSINSSSFEVLKKTETELKYKEINNGKPFFRSGESSQWKNKLNKTQLEILENELKEELHLIEYI